MSVRGLIGHSIKGIRLWLVGILLLSLALPIAANALTPLTKGYSADGKLALGSIVSLRDNSSDEVMAATSKNVDNILGVVIPEDGSLLAVRNLDKNQVLVATSGTEQVLVSDINGPIERGDHVTASPIPGVGMKASGNVRTIGIAQGHIQNTKEHTYTDSNDQEQTVTLGDAPVLVNVAYYFKEPDKTIVPSALQNIANALAGKAVNTLPIIISGAIFVVMLIVVVSIIYSMIKSSIISVGRNPMSQGAIYRDLIQLSALVLVILGVGFSSIYLVLTRV